MERLKEVERRKASEMLEARKEQIRLEMSIDPDGRYADLQRQVVEYSRGDEMTVNYFTCHSVTELISISLDGYPHLRLRVILGAIYPWCEFSTELLMETGFRIQNQIRDEQKRLEPWPQPRKVLIENPLSSEGRGPPYMVIHYPPTFLPRYWHICRTQLCFVARGLPLKTSSVNWLQTLFQSVSPQWIRDLTLLLIPYILL